MYFFKRYNHFNIATIRFVEPVTPLLRQSKFLIGLSVIVMLNDIKLEERKYCYKSEEWK